MESVFLISWSLQNLNMQLFVSLVILHAKESRVQYDKCLGKYIFQSICDGTEKRKTAEKLAVGPMFPLSCVAKHLTRKRSAAAFNCSAVIFNSTALCTFDGNQAAGLQTLVWRVETGCRSSDIRRASNGKQ